MTFINFYVGQGSVQRISERCHQLIDLLSSKGVKDVIVSPVMSDGSGKIEIVNENDELKVLRSDGGETVLTYGQIIDILNNGGI